MINLVLPLIQLKPWKHIANKKEGTSSLKKQI